MLSASTENEDPMHDDRLARGLKKLLPYRMAEALSAQGDDTDFIAEQLERYLGESDESERKVMASFHDDGGVDAMAEAVGRLTVPAPRQAQPSERATFN